MQALHKQTHDTADRDTRLRLYQSVNVLSVFSFLLLIFYSAEPYLRRVVKSYLANAFADDTLLFAAVYEIYSMFAYTSVFFLPLFLTLLLFYRNGITFRCAHPDIPFAMKLPKHPIASIFAVIGILYVIGDASSAAFTLLSEWGVPLATSMRTVPDTPMLVLLYFLSSVILPAFVEELVFRGYILHLLLPHGRTFAIMVSGVLFGLMHFYLPQLLYASVAGVLIGFLVVQSGSVWCGIFLHIVNNLLVFVSDMASVLLDAPTYLFFNVIFEGVIYLCGMIGLIILFASRSGFGRQTQYDSAEGGAAYAHTLSDAAAFRYALTPPLIAYIVCAVIKTVQNSFLFT